MLSQLPRSAFSPRYCQNNLWALKKGKLRGFEIDLVSIQGGFASPNLVTKIMGWMYQSWSYYG